MLDDANVSRPVRREAGGKGSSRYLTISLPYPAPDPFHHHCYLITPWEAGEATATVGVARTGLSAGASQIGLQAASSPASMSMTGIVLGERFIAVVP